MAAVLGEDAPNDEASWMRASLEICGGRFEWIEMMDDECEPRVQLAQAQTWRAAHGALLELRAEFIAAVAPTAEAVSWEPPETLAWGDEVWTRREQPEPLRSSFERCSFLFPALLEGACDPQTDDFPVAVALYSRTAAAPPAEGALGASHLGAAALPERLGASLVAVAVGLGSHALSGCFDPSYSPHVLNLVFEK